MDIQLKNIGKRFRRDWIFRNMDYHIAAGTHLAVTGANGSGKSTLIQVISSYLRPSEGTMAYKVNDEDIPADKIFNHLSYAAPYLTLPDDLTLEESVRFHGQFKPLVNNLSANEVMTLCYLEEHKSKPISQFSSGMIQRLKLVLTLASDVPLILLDEPTTNLDTTGINWYQDLIKKYAQGRTVIVCTNRPDEEAGFCTTSLKISDYQKA